MTSLRVGNARGAVIVHVKPVPGTLEGEAAGQQLGVIVVEGIWPNHRCDNGIGINALTSAEPLWPNGGAVFHDTAVWVRAMA